MILFSLIHKHTTQLSMFVMFMWFILAHWHIIIGPVTVHLHSVVSGDGTFLISSKDPDLDLRLGQCGDGAWDSILQFVFDGCSPDQLDGEI